jgi:hypothetical protein
VTDVVAEADFFASVFGHIELSITRVRFRSIDLPVRVLELVIVVVVKQSKPSYLSGMG